MSAAKTAESTLELLSHETLDCDPDPAAVAAALDRARARLAETSAQRLPDVHAEALAELEHMAEFPFGRFLLVNNGWNGYWTQYVITSPDWLKLRPAAHPLEARLLASTVFVSTQQRFRIFRSILQRELDVRVAPRAAAAGPVTLASVPCGLMDDLLGLDFTKTVPGDVKLLGMDLDPRALVAAADNAHTHGLEASAEFLQRDAWDLGINETVDVLTSNGLNIYVSSDDRIVALYASFFAALKPGGVLVTSALVPAPAGIVVDREFLVTRALLFEAIGMKFANYRPEALTRQQLEAVGFVDIEVIPDVRGIFPTFVGKKP